MAKQKLKYGSTVTYTTGRQFKVKVKGRVNENTISLFLEQYLGDTYEGGKRKIKKRRESLKRSIVLNPKTSIEKQQNKEVLIWAEKVRAKRENEMENNAEGIINTTDKNANFLSFMNEFLEEKKTRLPRSYRDLRAVTRAFFRYFGGDYLKTSALTPDLVGGFCDYLRHNYKKNTAHKYFSEFRRMLNAAVDRNIIIKSPANGMSMPQDTTLKKNTLTPLEIEKIENAKCPNMEVKRAFLFAMRTGLRHIDVKNMTWAMVDDMGITIEQIKTGTTVRIPMSGKAKALLGEPGESNEKVFKLTNLTTTLDNLDHLCKDAGIKKKITFHCARHTFATLLLSNGVDIKTVSTLLGHQSLKHTQKYIHAIDKNKYDAISRLDGIF